MNNNWSRSFNARMLRRNTDPDTSHRSAEQAKRLVASHSRDILEYIEKIYPLDATKSELAEALPNLDHVQIGRRMRELARRGFIIDTDVRRRNPSNRTEIAWKASREKTL